VIYFFQILKINWILFILVGWYEDGGGIFGRFLNKIGL
jgi:hypothetical protein